jgi:hypothetical protein
VDEPGNTIIFVKTDRAEVAYYYPAPFWRAEEGTWVKSLLLFFDQIAILLPRYMHGRHTAADPTLAEPLADMGLLRILEPNEWIDQTMAERLARAVVDLLTTNAFDDLHETPYFAELSQSRLGYGVDFPLGSWLVDELRQRGLARPSEDGVSIPLHPTVRTTILVILAQLARLHGPEAGLNINPTTADLKCANDMVRLLARERLPSAAHIVAFDLEPVTLDLSSVPLDEVLGYRNDNRQAHQAYLRDVRRFASDLAEITEPEEREARLLDRREELSDAGHELQRSARKAFGKNFAAWSLGLAGSWWSLAHGDPIGLAFAAIPVAAAAIPDTPTVSAYSYIFNVQHQLVRS